MLDLIKDEINVKEVIFDEKIEKDIELDVNITEELKYEGMVRELIRCLQEMRKELGLKPADKISVFIYSQPPFNKIFEDKKDFIVKEARGKDIYIGNEHNPQGTPKLDLEKEVLIAGQKISLGIKKY